MKIADHPHLLENFERQAVTCTSMGAPFTAQVCRVLARTLTDAHAMGRRVLAWPQATLRGDLVPLRCCAALNMKVRSGEAPGLAAFYPPHTAGDDHAFGQAIDATIAAHDAWMTGFLESAPQTNEVARSALLLAGFLEIARVTGMPLAIHELGASAGLNLQFDSYRYDLGEGRTWGPADARVRIPCAWSGPAPSLSTPIAVLSRAAVDLRPLDAASHEDRERLLSYIWPEQTERVARISAALESFARSGLKVAQGDALAWTQAQLAAPQASGTARVFYHSVFIQYLPPDLRQALRARLTAAGDAATAERPFAWLAMESAPDNPQTCQLTLRLSPGGTRRTFAAVDWHGKSAQFTGS